MQQKKLFDKTLALLYGMCMFVSVVLDPGSADSARALATILSRYHFRKIQRACWEGIQVAEQQLTDLKREMDLVTDYYDTIRMYQYPVKGCFAITELSKKKWKRCLMATPQN